MAPRIAQRTKVAEELEKAKGIQADPADR